ncbi:hypothetical protein NDU88_001359 [Pleurodeles waltl]|uniref:Uncharacterized protein n=1 Tax=Pleurodeles waltl TaxID=8319 RepID=A0AAV7V9K6_PLEWA|nr:hypothetical protein NDU88_001359 [Pleurodeles waltl]
MHVEAPTLRGMYKYVRQPYFGKLRSARIIRNNTYGDQTPHRSVWTSLRSAHIINPTQKYVDFTAIHTHNKPTAISTHNTHELAHFTATPTNKLTVIHMQKTQEFADFTAIRKQLGSH